MRGERSDLKRASVATSRKWIAGGSPHSSATPAAIDSLDKQHGNCRRRVKEIHTFGADYDCRLHRLQFSIGRLTSNSSPAPISTTRSAGRPACSERMKCSAVRRWAWRSLPGAILFALFGDHRYRRRGTAVSEGPRSLLGGIDFIGSDFFGILPNPPLSSSTQCCPR